jgi:type VI protein secretion system component Hcp
MSRCDAECHANLSGDTFQRHRTPEVWTAWKDTSAERGGFVRMTSKPRQAFIGSVIGMSSLITAPPAAPGQAVKRPSSIGVLRVSSIQEDMAVFQIAWQGQVDLQDAATGVGTSERPMIGEIRVRKRVSASSPLLMKGYVVGRRYQQASITLFALRGQPEVNYVLDNALITSIGVTPDEEGVSFEDLRLAFLRFTQTSGGASASYDADAGKE